MTSWYDKTIKEEQTWAKYPINDSNQRVVHNNELLQDSTPGLPIGIREIQSILMSATQTSLSHFHTAGMSQTDVHKPSIADTLNCVYKWNNTSMIIKSDMDIRELRKRIVYKRLDSLVIKVKSDLIGIPERENIWYEVLEQKMFENIFIRLYIDYKKMRELGLTLNDIGEICFQDINCKWFASPDFMGMIDVGEFGQYIQPILSKMKAQISGRECTKIIMSCEQHNDNFITEGSNILSVSKFSKVLKSNDVIDVEKRLGIEAASGVLAELIGSSIVSDFMTRTGTVLSFSKNSIEVSRKGILTSMGFERPKDDIRNAISDTSDKDSEKPLVYDSIIHGNDPHSLFELNQVLLI